MGGSVGNTNRNQFFFVFKGLGHLPLSATCQLVSTLSKDGVGRFDRA